MSVRVWVQAANTLVLAAALALAACAPRLGVDASAEREPPPDSSAPDLRSMQWELTLRTAEWDLHDDTLQWRIDPDGTTWLCWGDAEQCAHPDTPHDAFDDFAEALEAIDAHGVLRDHPLDFETALGVGYGLRHVDEPLRAIDKLFWALTIGGLTDAFYSRAEIRPTPHAPLGEIDAHLDWVAQRYGLTRRGHFSPGDPSVPTSAMERADDIAFGTFVDEQGTWWHCGHDVSPGKYCCYIYCNSEHDSLTEGH